MTSKPRLDFELAVLGGGKHRLPYAVGSRYVLLGSRRFMLIMVLCKVQNRSRDDVEDKTEVEGVRRAWLCVTHTLLNLECLNERVPKVASRVYVTRSKGLRMDLVLFRFGRCKP